MGVEMKFFMMISVATICLSSVAFASQGTATFYTPPYVPSACNGFKNDGTMIAAASDVLWNNGAVCNKSFRIRCTGPTNQGIAQPCRGGTIVVKIVDYCPAGCAGTIDLSREAFSQIANPDAGKIKIEYNQV
ncbi:EG45-like domain containing protein [Melia azedarach]|uniref:EG45-like domain containing protein n=1 Tax=Melia azedarach TaxID=155640 RepID=A0ACC1XDP1_MELAZ|nr:EG45-like domain containing protein [Melia azedarach]